MGLLYRVLSAHPASGYGRQLASYTKACRDTYPLAPNIMHSRPATRTRVRKTFRTLRPVDLPIGEGNFGKLYQKARFSATMLCRKPLRRYREAYAFPDRLGQAIPVAQNRPNRETGCCRPLPNARCRGNNLPPHLSDGGAASTNTVDALAPKNPRTDRPLALDHRFQTAPAGKITASTRPPPGDLFAVRRWLSKHLPEGDERAGQV